MIRINRRGLVTAAAVALVPLFSACSSGLDSSPLAAVRNVSHGDNARVGDMLIRNAFVLGPTPGERIPQGGKAAVYFTLVSRENTADRLVSVSAPRTAGSVTISGSSIDIPPQQVVNVGSTPNRVILSGLTQPLVPGNFVTVTLRFAKAGSTTLSLPTLPRVDGWATLQPASPSPSVSPSPGAPSPSPSAPVPSPSAPVPSP